jgi:hypothetical protein
LLARRFTAIPSVRGSLRFLQQLFLTVGLALCAVPAKAGDRDEASVLLDKAILAHGGESNLTKFMSSVVITKFKARVYNSTFTRSWCKFTAFTYTGQSAIYGMDMRKDIAEVKTLFHTHRLVVVVNENKGWTRFADKTEEMKKSLLVNFQEDSYASWVANLVPLKDRAFTLQLLGEAKVDKRPALCILISCKNHRDMKLFFDKELGLLVKTETIITDEDGVESNVETVLRDYKDVYHIKQAMKIVVNGDGKPSQDIEILELRLADRPENGMFDKP